MMAMETGPAIFENRFGVFQMIIYRITIQPSNFTAVTCITQENLEHISSQKLVHKSGQNVEIIQMSLNGWMNE